MLQFSDYVNNSKKNINENDLLVIFGAGIVGRLTFEALKEKNIKVDYFCDSNVKKQKIQIENTKVISPSDLDKFNKNINIFVSTHYFSSVVPFLENKGFKNLYKSSDLLASTDMEKVYKPYWASQVGIGDLPYITANRLVDYYNKMSLKEDYIKDDKLNLKIIDIQVTERCSLKCKDCSNLMQYYKKPQNSEINLLFKSIERIMECIDNLDEFRVLGGDPFMNKELYKIINKLVTYEKCKRIVVYTNAKIVPKGENLSCLKNKKVSLYITNYGEKSFPVNSKLIELGKKENINVASYRCTTWLDCGRVIPYSGKSEKELEHQFKNCCTSDLISLLHGKLYRCPFAANGVNLKAIPRNTSDEVDLINNSLNTKELREQIKKLCYDKKYLTACSYCNGRDYSTASIPSAIQTKKPLHYQTVNNN
jgi:hypothetical protein